MGNSRPFAACRVISDTRGLCGSHMSVSATRATLSKKLPSGSSSKSAADGEASVSASCSRPASMPAATVTSSSTLASRSSPSSSSASAASIARYPLRSSTAFTRAATGPTASSPSSRCSCTNFTKLVWARFETPSASAAAAAASRSESLRSAAQEPSRSSDVLPIPRGGTFTTRKNASSSLGFLSNRNQATMSRISRRLKNSRPRTNWYGTPRPRRATSSERESALVRKRIA